MPFRGPPRGGNKYRGGKRGGGGFGGQGDRFEGDRNFNEGYGGYKNFSHPRGGQGISKRGVGGSNRSRGGKTPPFHGNRNNLRPLGYLIKVMHANNEDQMELMQSLEQKIGSSLNADNINISDNYIEFTISSEAIAFKLEKISGQLKNSQGKRMAIFKKNWFGDRTVSTADEEKLKELLNKFYKPNEKFLDLSNFLEKQDGPGMGLKKFWISQKTYGAAVCKIIGAYIPQLEILDLSNNGLFNMFPYGDLPANAPNLSKLNVSFNRMSDVSNLEPIKKLKLTEIILDGNPLCGHYKDQSSYVKDVHRKFPLVQMLDGHPVKATIGFDLDAAVEKTLPKFLGNLTHDITVKTLVYAFAEQYFTVFDKDDRGTLLMDAYDTNAMLSITMWFPEATRDTFKINKLFPQTRNLTRYTGSKSNDNLLRGKFKVLGFLGDIPNTEHDLPSFRIDIMLETPKLVVFTVSGVLREKGSTDVFAFSRTFSCKPFQGGLQIVNEFLHYRQALDFERRRAFTNPGPTPSNSPVVAQTEVPGVAATAVGLQQQPQVLTDAQKEEMVKKFSMQSGLNLKWSLDCLNANSWNYDVAAVDFQRAKGAGDIPPDAYNPVAQ